MKMLANLRNLGVGAALLAAFACPASATTTVMSFTLSDTSVSGFNDPFGTVTVTQLTNGSLGFDVKLADHYSFHTSANHNSFAFGLDGYEKLYISNLSHGFTYLGYGPFKEAGFSGNQKNWDYAFNCTNCTGGWKGPTSLSFVVTDKKHDLDLDDLVSSFSFLGDDIYMTADLRNCRGLTGNVGATLDQPGVPEPATWGMLLLGFGLIGTAMRRRRHVAITA